MILYHGTTLGSALDIVNNGIDLTKSKNFLDFGRGFYTTPDYGHAVRCSARAFRHKYHTSPNDKDLFVVKVEYKENSDLNIRTFTETGIEWCKFILNNRLHSNILKANNIKYHNQDAKYDVCIGEIADGLVTTYVRMVNKGDVSLESLDLEDILQDISNEYPLQYSFHSDKALNYITNMEFKNAHISNRKR